MLCRKPFVRAGAAFPCGQCMPCRYNRRRMWAHRIMLESLCHRSSVFATLTYNDEKMPVKDDKGILVPRHLQLWLKRLRDAVAPLKFRFYGVGEYGTDNPPKFGRPHFHVVLFGINGCARGKTLANLVTGESRWSECCDMCRLIGNTWGNGDIFLGTVTRDSAGYVCEYTVKKWTKADTIELVGRPPEFCRMSLRPGIGADAMWDVASDLIKNGLDETMVDVPQALAHGRSKMPLGRYLRSKLRLAIGREGGAPVETLEAMAEELRPLREAAFNASSSFSEALARSGDQAVANIEARNAIYRKVKK